MATDVVIAYRDLGCPHRRRTFEFVHAWYLDHGFTVIVEGGDDFTRARGLNRAIARSSAEVIVQSDPDSLVPFTQLTDAIAAAEASPGLVVPHDRYLYLDLPSTDRVLAGEPLDSMTPANCEDHGKGVGNVTVFSRATWEQAGGFDERFGIWGGDDGAFAYATDAMVAPMRRLTGDMVHLWHPRLPQSIPGTPGFVEQFAILAEYRDAAADSPAAVRALVDAR